MTTKKQLKDREADAISALLHGPSQHCALGGPPGQVRTIGGDGALRVWELSYRVAVAGDSRDDIDIRLAEACYASMTFIEFIGLGLEDETL